MDCAANPTPMMVNLLVRSGEKRAGSPIIRKMAEPHQTAALSRPTNFKNPVTPPNYGIGPPLPSRTCAFRRDVIPNSVGNQACLSSPVPLCLQHGSDKICRSRVKIESARLHRQAFSGQELGHGRSNGARGGFGLISLGRFSFHRRRSSYL